jgi:hypothetical protein
LRCLKGQRVILDGEIVVLDEKGRSNFFDLMAHRGEHAARAETKLKSTGWRLTSCVCMSWRDLTIASSSQSSFPVGLLSVASLPLPATLAMHGLGKMKLAKQSFAQGT